MSVKVAFHGLAAAIVASGCTGTIQLADKQSFTLISIVSRRTLAGAWRRVVGGMALTAGTQLRSSWWGPPPLHPSPTSRTWPFPSLGSAASDTAPTSPARGTGACVQGLAGTRSSLLAWVPASASGRVRDMSIMAAGRSGGSGGGDRSRPDARERTPGGAGGGGGRGAGGKGKAPGKDVGAARRADRDRSDTFRSGVLAGGMRAPSLPAARRAPPQTAGPGAGSGAAGESGLPPPHPPPPQTAASQEVTWATARSQSPDQLPPVHGALLRVVGPLEAAGWAYWAVRRTAAWLQGAHVPLQHSHHQQQQQQQQQNQQQQAVSDVPGGSWPQGLPQAVAGGVSGSSAGEAVELELELQWDQLAAAHELFARPGSGWVASPIQQQPALGRAEFSLAAAAQPQPGPAGERGAAEPAAPAVTVVLGCTYNTVLRANPARVQVAAAPPQQLQLQQQQQQQQAGGTSAATSSSTESGGLLRVLVGPQAEAGGAAGQRRQHLVRRAPRVRA